MIIKPINSIIHMNHLQFSNLKLWNMKMFEFKDMKINNWVIH